MMDFTQIGTCGGIGVLCYLVGLWAKNSTKVKDNYIPVIVGVVGGALGILGMFVIPNFPENDVINACAVGIISGLASTGADQIYKQVKKDA